MGVICITLEIDDVGVIYNCEMMWVSCETLELCGCHLT